MVPGFPADKSGLMDFARVRKNLCGNPVEKQLDNLRNLLQYASGLAEVSASSATALGEMPRPGQRLVPYDLGNISNFLLMFGSIRLK